MSIEDGYAICFNEWALDKNIKNELGLLLIISGLTAEKGYCFAKNSYFAELFDVPEDTISRKIKKLEELNYLTIRYEKRGAEIVARHIFLTRILQNQADTAIPRTTNLRDDEPQICGTTNHKNSVRYNIYKNTIDNNTIPNRGSGSNQNTNAITEEKIINQPPAPPRVSAPRVKVGCQLPVQVKSKLVNMDPIAKKALTDYCLYLIETYNFQKTALCNRIDEVCRKSRNIAQSIQAICNYNMNGGYKQCFVPGNLGKVVADAVVVSEQATEEDFVRDENGNIEEDW